MDWRKPLVGARCASLERRSQQRQPIIPEIHVVPIEVERGGAETAALHKLIGIGSQSVLDALLRDACEEALALDAQLDADRGQHIVP